MRTILFLPELRLGRSVRCALPISPWCAALLARGLLSEPAERQPVFQAALYEEPSLAVWAVCQSGHGESPPSLSDLAGWLAGACDEQLAECRQVSVDGEAADGWAELAAISVAVARTAEKIAGSSAASDGPTPYLLGLLHRTPDWLQAVSVAERRSGAGLGDLPSWLGAALAGLERLDADGPVGTAILRLHAKPPAARLRRLIADRWSAGDTFDLAGALPAAARLRSRLMLLEKEFAAQLEIEKLKSLRELAYGASHEINNPLANISTRAQTLLRDEQDPQRRQKLATISTQAFRAHEMISDMMLFAKPPQLSLSSLNVAELIETVIVELQAVAVEQGTILRHACDDSIGFIPADGTQLAVAIKALVQNSIEAIDLGGQVDVAVATSGDSSEWIEVTVTDTGPGVAPEVRRHLFDPFYSGREAGRGLGLGLSKCWRIVDLHGGSINVANLPEGGAQFTIRLPAEQPQCPIRSAG